MVRARLWGAGCALLILAACQSGNSSNEEGGTGAGASIPDPNSTQPYDGIAEDEVLRLIGTEPFWGGQVTSTLLTYTTPENQEGVEIPVQRFAGRGGISFTGAVDGQDVEMMVTPLVCSDQMSDREYPFTVTLKIGEETRNGCAWSEQNPFEGPEAP